jgi:hypothetical protein
MIPPIEVKVDDSGGRGVISVITTASGNFRRPLKQFQAYQNNVTINHFNALRLGGSHRGVYWPYFAPSSFGRKRPSGKVIRPGDAIVQDTRTYLRSLTMSPDVQELTPMSITWGSRLDYADDQHKLRPVMFYTQRDKEVAEELLLEHLIGGP